MFFLKTFLITYFYQRKKSSPPPVPWFLSWTIHPHVFSLFVFNPLDSSSQDGALELLRGAGTFPSCTLSPRTSESTSCPICLKGTHPLPHVWCFFTRANPHQYYKVPPASAAHRGGPDITPFLPGAPWLSPPITYCVCQQICIQALQNVLKKPHELFVDVGKERLAS